MSNPTDIATIIHVVLDHVRPQMLRQCLARRHGILTDGYFGFSYPEDLDGWDLANGESIPPGMVALDAGYGAPDTEVILVSEHTFHQIAGMWLENQKS